MAFVFLLRKNNSENIKKLFRGKADAIVIKIVKEFPSRANTEMGNVQTSDTIANFWHAVPDLFYLLV
uniref:Uncharacterized protein n=1 Tax=Oryza glumipatula TaxID=40148 RepID=A0A0E0BUQ3_9ORYZ